jgi:hypothetical protein
MIILLSITGVNAAARQNTTLVSGTGDAYNLAHYLAMEETACSRKRQALSLQQGV